MGKDGSLLFVIILVKFYIENIFKTPPIVPSRGHLIESPLMGRRRWEFLENDLSIK